jgi:hypothetical protein
MGAGWCGTQDLVRCATMKVAVSLGWDWSLHGICGGSGVLDACVRD